jgi:tRNA A-37 threonylcarbamoyl transferase component Bud32
MRTQQSPLFSLVHPEFFEPVERLSPDRSEYLDLVLELLPAGWAATPHGTWFQCSAPGYAFPAQGWKIHVSATTHNALATLSAVVPVLAREHVTFKFACDRRLLSYLNSKRWDRGGSGKFVTVYPRDEAHFRQLIEALHAATRELAGPYILSDRRYKDSRCVHYRYGSLRMLGERDAFGRRMATIAGPDGSSFIDVRGAAFTPPPWVVDPFAGDEQPQDEQEAGTLCGGRYKVDGVLAFSNSGGVYVATDRSTARKVVIKEARPLVSWTSEHDDARALLRKEYRILRTLEQSGVAVRPLDYFCDWEHEFLVEEHLTGVPLAAVPARRSILLRTRATEADVQAYYDGFRAIFTRLCEIVDTVHRHGIVLCDLSPNNLIYDETAGTLTAIDFEAAFEPGTDVPTRLATEGFVSRDGAPSVQGDVFALGAVMLHHVFNYSGQLQLSPGSKSRIVQDVLGNARLPAAVRDAIADALADRPQDRPGVSRIGAALDESERIAAPPPPSAWDGERVRAMLASTLAYIVQSADTARTDRLFPACFRMFETNPLGLWYGATGTAAALHRIAGDVPGEILAWIDACGIDPDAYPPGYTVGLSGVAWALLDLGRAERGARLLELCERHPRLAESCDLGIGLAGWGMACLRFFHATRDERHLVRARDAAAAILARADRDDAGRRFWRQADGVHIGMLRGGSGIALFLLHLGLLTADEHLVAAGRSALDFDLAQARPTPDGGVTFGYRTDFDHIVVPYWAYGSAGIGSVLIRYLRFAGGDDLLPQLDGIALDTERKYTVLAGKQYGLAGIGGFNLDAYAFTGRPRFLDAARLAFEGLELHALARETGTAFAGDFQSKISCDYATGSAGVAIFLDRLANGRGAELMLDELLPASS